MTFKLDQMKNRTPSEAVNELKDKYTSELDSEHQNEAEKSDNIGKEILALSFYKALLRCSRLVFVLSELLILASALLYSGFATSQTVGRAVLVFLVLSVMFVVVCFSLAVCRQMYFRTALMLARITLGICALAVSLIVFILFGVPTYALVLLALIFANVLNHAFAKTISFALQSICAIISLVLVAVPILCVLGVIRDDSGSTHHERELYSRYAKYAIVEDSDEKYAELGGVMLNLNDVLSVNRGEVYRVAGTVIKDIPVTALGYGAFKDAAAITRVSLPESLKHIRAGAFEGSSVRTVEIYAPVVYLDDCFEGSKVEIVRLLSDSAATVVINGDRAIPDNIAFYVPEELLWECRSRNPELADSIIAIQDQEEE